VTSCQSPADDAGERALSLMMLVVWRNMAVSVDAFARFSRSAHQS
jgi:hypothetical protein